MARDKNKRSLTLVSHYLFVFWKEELLEKSRKGRQEASYNTPCANVISFPDLTLSSPERGLSTRLITHSTLGLAENT